jgi:hypothetical protein
MSYRHAIICMLLILRSQKSISDSSLRRSPFGPIKSVPYSARISRLGVSHKVGLRSLNFG